MPSPRELERDSGANIAIWDEIVAAGLVSLDLKRKVRRLPALLKGRSVATHRTKKSIKSRPKYKQDRSLKTRRKKAKLAAAQKKGRNRAKAKRQKRNGRK